MSRQTVIAYASRSAIGKLSGAFQNMSAPKISAALISDMLTRTKIKPELIEEVMMGEVLTAGVGQAPARQAAIFGGLPKSVRATTVNRVCGSGLKSVMLADQAIRLSDAECILAGGQENMTLAPHLLMQSRSGYKFGSVEMKDSMQWDGLWDPYNNMAMGNCGEVCAKEYAFSREAQDEFALDSYKKSRKASEAGYFEKEIVPIEVNVGKSTQLVKTDEEPFSVDLEKLKTLRPAFAKDGTVTAGNASSINDGAAVLLLCSENFAKQNNLPILAKIIGQSSYAHDPVWFTTAPVNCIKNLLQKVSMKVSDIDLFEINEAFSVVPMAAMKDLSIPKEKVNISGGAVSLGHPIGASGARILVTLIHNLHRTSSKYGIATLCIGGGEASAVLISVP